MSPELKKGTSKIHEQAHNLNFLSRLLKGSIDSFPISIYFKLLISLYHIYSTLELALEKNSSHPVVREIFFPEELERTKALLLDINYYSSLLKLGQESVSLALNNPSEATTVYVQRLKEIASTDPSLLVAHSYTRYLGDLSGGQIMEMRIKRVFSLPSFYSKGETASYPGVEFYHFDELGMTIAQFKELYKHRLDSIFYADKAKEIVAEAVHAFSLIMNIYLELDAELPPIQIIPSSGISNLMDNPPRVKTETRLFDLSSLCAIFVSFVVVLTALWLYHSLVIAST